MASLGNQLKEHRKNKQFTQQHVAARAGLSIPTVIKLEKGKGNLTSWLMVLQILELELVGRNLPAGNSIGVQIRDLRKRRNLNQKSLAALINSTHPTIIRLEKENNGRVETLEKTLTTLGAGAYLAKKGSKKAFYTHSGNSSVSHTWQTPKSLLDSIYQVFSIDLDPCSPTNNKRNAPVKANVHYTEEDNGLELPWFGTVFLNPPYGRELKLWIEKAKREVEIGNAKTTIALIPARTDTIWWHKYIAGYAHILFLKGRLCFGESKQSAPFPSALVIWGSNEEQRQNLKMVFPDSWSM